MRNVMNEFKGRLRAGKLVLCVALLSSRTIDAPFIAAAFGADTVYVDLEHGVTSLESAALLCGGALGAGIIPLVRVPMGQYSLASRLLDAGAAGVLLPHIDSAEQAEEAVREFRFAPLGRRSFGGFGMPVGYRGMSQPDMLNLLNSDTTLLAMVETPKAVANADAIAAVDGVDVLLVGTNDLCIEMGIPGDLRNPRLKEALLRVAEACRKSNKILGIGGIRNDMDHFQEVLEMGASFLIIGSDAGYLGSGIRRDTDNIRNLAETHANLGRS